MSIRTLLCAFLLLNACLIPAEEPGMDAGPLGGGSAQRCVVTLGFNETVCVTIGPVVCGGQTCARGEVCCQTTGACVAPASGVCPNPPSTAPNNPKSCGSNADCSSDEFCAPDDTTRCITASGHCQAMNNCGFCSPAGSPQCQVCGCNGVTYPSIQASCVAGTTYVRHGPCGVAPNDAGVPSEVACGRDDQCPTGAACCFRTGTCFDPSEPWRCQAQPDGGLLDCTTDAECNRAPSGGGPGGNDGFCSGSSFGTSPGSCLGRGNGSSCGGEVRQVCGCDGTTYVNACWARVGGTRIAHDGQCP